MGCVDPWIRALQTWNDGSLMLRSLQWFSLTEPWGEVGRSVDFVFHFGDVDDDMKLDPYIVKKSKSMTAF